MHLFYRNVNEAFTGIVSAIQTCHILTTVSPSRNGNVLKVAEPVIVTYTHPRERVLFNQARDCNPFFHLFEALWMLAGRNDVASLAYYVSTIGDFSDNGKTLNGAYGYRWRLQPLPYHLFGAELQIGVASCQFGGDYLRVDQLKIIIDQLRKDLNSRRCVLQMWNIQDDLLKETKDKCCNTHAYFSVENKRLDMTVCNRSNDLIWGMLGANVVHFSFLQEYLAACIGVEVGVYNQFTNNLHAYINRWFPGQWLSDHHRDIAEKPAISYNQPLDLNPLLVANPERFDKECAVFIDSIDGTFEEPFLRYVAQPMMAAFRAHKHRNYYGDNSALTLIDRVHADDWRIAGRNWIEKRQRTWERKNEHNPYTARELDRQAKEAEASSDKA